MSQSNDDVLRLPGMVVTPDGNAIQPGKYRQYHPDGYVEEFEVIYRDNKPRIVTTDVQAAETFRRDRRKAMQSIKPLKTAPKGKIVPIPPGKVDASNPTVEQRHNRRAEMQRWLDDPNVPEWRKKRARALIRNDI